jgi:hypothetical protein
LLHVWPRAQQLVPQQKLPMTVWQQVVPPQHVKPATNWQLQVPPQDSYPGVQTHSPAQNWF